ncbi:MAG: hypothetical protein ACREC6_11620 [Hyphomicrobiaceae bacterium]
MHAYFATNRKRVKGKEPTESFGPEEADVFALGRAVVRIPERELRALAKRCEEGVGFLHRARGTPTSAELTFPCAIATAKARLRHGVPTA